MKNQSITEIASELARANSISPADIVGFGQGGRVLKSDVEESESEHSFSPQR